MGKQASKSSFFKTITDWGKALLLALIFALLVRGFIFESFVVGSQKMEKTIYNGDYILVNKVGIGARIPITILSIPFTDAYSQAIQMPYWRLPGYKNIAYNDLLVFNYPGQFDPPIDKKVTMVKRCVALPGDTITILKKKLLINNVRFIEKSTLQFNYRVVAKAQWSDDAFLKKYNITEGGKVNEMGIYDFTMDTATARLIGFDTDVQNVRELKEVPGENATLYFPNSLIYNWNKDNFGPLLVPKKGLTVKLNYQNFYLYKTIIELFEGNTMYKKGDELYLNNKLVTDYTFKQNYYFVLDDNRDNAKDSRFWGFLPESHVTGTAQFVWFSVDKQNGKVRWNRLFKHLN